MFYTLDILVPCLYYTLHAYFQYFVINGGGLGSDHLRLSCTDIMITKTNNMDNNILKLTWLVIMQQKKCYKVKYLTYLWLRFWSYACHTIDVLILSCWDIVAIIFVAMVIIINTTFIRNVQITHMRKIFWITQLVFSFHPLEKQLKWQAIYVGKCCNQKPRKILQVITKKLNVGGPVFTRSNQKLNIL